MTITSAVPANLEVFAGTLVTARTACSHNVTSAIVQSNAMIAACGGAGVSSTNLASLEQLLANFAANEAYVRTVHDELVAADHAGSTPASVSDAVLLAALQTGPLRERHDAFGHVLAEDRRRSRRPGGRGRRRWRDVLRAAARTEAVRGPWASVRRPTSGRR